MKHLKALAMAAVAVIAIGAGSSAARADLVFATDAAPYPPFTSQNAAGEWEGWEYDLLQALCAEMNEKCTLIPVAWDGIIPSLLEKKIEKYFVPAGASLKTYKGQDEANADLAAGRLDAVQADGVTLGNFLASAEGACCELYGAVPVDVEVLGPGVGVGLRKEDTALLEKINAAIKSLAAKGGFEELTTKYKLDGLLTLPPKG